MRATLLSALVAASLTAPQPAAASPAGISVDVNVIRAVETRAWVEFSPERSSFVALYGVFSDGTLRPLFPEVEGYDHWVEAREVRVVGVDVPEGIRLESVQAVASARWFDPGQLWIASAEPGRTRGLSGSIDGKAVLA